MSALDRQECRGLRHLDLRVLCVLRVRFSGNDLELVARTTGPATSRRKPFSTASSKAKGLTSVPTVDEGRKLFALHGRKRGQADREKKCEFTEFHFLEIFLGLKNCSTFRIFLISCRRFDHAFGIGEKGQNVVAFAAIWEPFRGKANRVDEIL